MPGDRFPYVSNDCTVQVFLSQEEPLGYMDILPEQAGHLRGNQHHQLSGGHMVPE